MQIFEDILPHYLALGVDYKTFMESNPYEMSAYDKAFKIRRQVEDERDWYMGQYVASAFATVLSGAFSKSNKQSYVEKPFFANLLNDEENAEKDVEYAEKKAMLEMQTYISLLQKENKLPPTIIKDIPHKGD